MKLGIIEARSLTRIYDGLVTVDHIDLDVEEGEIFGFLGPNGAGKTTTIKMLTTLLKPTEGEARICSYDVVRQPSQVRRVIGVVFQDPALDDRLTGWENLDFHARLYGMDRREREESLNIQAERGLV
ncbi:MAG: ATP-binding cassette domain-containing protein [Nitrososphaerota archaeon]